MGIGSDQTRLIVLRGNSGSGKSSVAKALREAYGRGVDLDVSIAETLRRHATRPQAAEFGADDMRG
jgi:guanylate kinase